LLKSSFFCLIFFLTFKLELIFYKLNSQFHNLSLQGKTGVLAGLFSLFFIYFIKYFISEFSYSNGFFSVLPISFVEFILVGISAIFILFLYVLIVIINKKRRIKNHITGWEVSSKKIRLIYLIGLIIGGILLLFYLKYGYLKHIIPTSIFLYGVACKIVNKFTKGKTNILGMFFLINAAISILVPKYQFQLWALSFGVYHIIYGVIYSK